MPTYRKLHTKITESLDVNDMPDDFHRLFWTLLPLALCREGRGLLNGAWLKSKLFPLREDIDHEHVRQAFQWFIDYGMVVPYAVDGREYFYVPTFEKYQGTTIKERESDYPPPPDLLQTNSRPTPDPLPTNSATDSTAAADSTADSTAEAPPAPAARPAAAVFTEAEQDALELLGTVPRLDMAVVRRKLPNWTLAHIPGWVAIAQDLSPPLGARLLVSRMDARDPPPRDESDRRRFVEGEYADFIQH